MADRLREAGISVELAISEDIRGCDNRVIQTIYRICQEASTNSIKHGKATQVVMSIKRKESTILVHIVDNGKGCASFSKGNGLERYGRTGEGNWRKHKLWSL
jgi:signal transduction histidine kinase